MFYSGAIKTGPRRQPFGVKLFYYNLWAQPYSLVLAQFFIVPQNQKLLCKGLIQMGLGNLYLSDIIDKCRINTVCWHGPSHRLCPFKKQNQSLLYFALPSAFHSLSFNHGSGKPVWKGECILEIQKRHISLSSNHTQHPICTCLCQLEIYRRT